MDRRRFLLSSLVGSLAAPLGLEVGQASMVPRIGVLPGASPAPSHPVEGLRQGLRDLGYVDGQNIAIDDRWAEGRYDRSPSLQPTWCIRRLIDNWTGVGLITVGVERLGPRLRLTHLEENEWRASSESNARFAPDGFGVAATPWGAVQRAALHALRRD